MSTPAQGATEVREANARDGEGSVAGEGRVGGEEKGAGGPADEKRKRGRGEGEAMDRATFRDPIGVLEEVAGIKLDIARTLVRAPSLPVELPAYGLMLVDVVVDKKSISLVLGKPSPIARLKLERATDAGAPLVGIGKSGVAKAAVVQVTIEEVHADTKRFLRELQTMAERVRASITVEKWEQALEQGKRLRGVPVGVPLAFYRQIVPGIDVGQGLVRTGFLCNQDCGICWQDRDWGRFPAEQVLTWIEDLAAAGAKQLIISGGEPTLDGKLESYIRRAKELGFRAVTLETNAIQFSKPGLAARLRDAGLSDCFVSLHSGDAATSDAITRAPGTFVRTVAGIQALLEAGVTVSLNCVMTREGIDHLEGVPDFVHATFGNHPKLTGLMMSQPTDPYDRTLLPGIVPEPERLRSVLRTVIDRAFALGVTVRGLDGPCGPPLCAFDADRRITSLKPISEVLDGRTYLPSCTGCAVRSACFGVRVADVELYGDACARPIEVAPAV